MDDKEDVETMQRAIRIKALPVGWRDHFRQQIAQLGKQIMNILEYVN